MTMSLDTEWAAVMTYKLEAGLGRIKFRYGHYNVLVLTLLEQDVSLG